MKPRFSRFLLLPTIVIISALLMLDILLTRRNNRIIEENRLLQRQAEELKIGVSQLAIDIIHNVDLGIRSFALFKDEKYLYPWNVALSRKDSLLRRVEERLKAQNYPIQQLRIFKDSTEAYIRLNKQLFLLAKANEMDKFLPLADQDRGYRLWLQYESLMTNVHAFEDKIIAEAQAEYKQAERNNVWIEVVLILISIPTLLITAYNTNQKFSMEARLRAAEVEKAALLESQNQVLEETVKARTEEISKKNLTLLQQHEEITAQNEELVRQRESLAVQNQALRNAKKRELDLYSQNLLEKSELINHLRDEIEALRTNSDVHESKLTSFNRILHSTLLTDDDWDRFRSTFDDVYPNFFATLRYRIQDVTPSELKLAALIKMNLSLKEASSTLAISTESVRKSRYRFKKRIGLGEEESLEDFIRSL